MAGQARDLPMRTEGESSVIITARACFVPQRLLTQPLSDNEQLEILALLEAVCTDRSAMRAARALAELMGHLHGLGQRIAGELSDQDRDIKPARR
jgi:hypothetical protein